MFIDWAHDQTQRLPRISGPEGRARQVHRNFYGTIRVPSYGISKYRVNEIKCIRCIIMLKS